MKHAVANEGYQCHVFGLNLIEMSLFPMLSESLDQLINKISNEYAAEAFDGTGNCVWF